MKKHAFAFISAILFGIIVFATTGTVIGQNSQNGKDEDFYHIKEKEYVGLMREYLNEAGYKNSGVTMTRVIDEEGRREYTVTLHNRKFDYLSENEKYSLINHLESLEFEVDNGGFCHKFLPSNV